MRLLLYAQGALRILHPGADKRISGYADIDYQLISLSAYQRMLLISAYQRMSGYSQPAHYQLISLWAHIGCLMHYQLISLSAHLLKGPNISLSAHVRMESNISLSACQLISACGNISLTAHGGLLPWFPTALEMCLLGGETVAGLCGSMLQATRSCNLQ
jgi:hypothetical protein